MSSRTNRKTLGALTLATFLSSSSLAAAEVTMAYEVEYPIETAVLVNGQWQCQQNDGQITGSRKQLELFVVGETLDPKEADGTPKVAPNQWFATTDDPHIKDWFQAIPLARLVRKLTEEKLPAERLPTSLVPKATDHTCWKRDATLQYGDYQRGLTKWKGYEQDVKNVFSSTYISSSAPANNAHFASADAFAAAAVAGDRYSERLKGMAGVLEMKTRGTISVNKAALKATRAYLQRFLRTDMACKNYCDTTGLGVRERIARMNECSKDKAGEYESALAGLHVFSTTHGTPGDVIIKRECNVPEVRALETQITTDIRLASIAANCDADGCTPASLSQFVTEAYALPLLRAGQVDELYRQFLALPSVTAALTGRTPNQAAEFKGLLVIIGYWMYRGGALKSSISPLPKATVHDLTKAVRKTSGISDAQWEAIRTDVTRICTMLPVDMADYRASIVSDALAKAPAGNPAPFNGHAGSFPVKDVGGKIEFAIEYRPKDAVNGMIGPHARFFQQHIHREADPTDKEYDDAIADLNQDYP